MRVDDPPFVPVQDTTEKSLGREEKRKRGREVDRGINSGADAFADATHKAELSRTRER